MNVDQITKRGLNILLSSIFMMSVMAQEQTGQQTNIRLATAYKTNGTYVFIDNDPISEYDVIDHQESAISWTGQYAEIKNKLVKKAVKETPDADGILLNLVNGGVDRAAVIKFKSTDKQQISKTLVNKENGLCVFAECEPDVPYTILGREKVHVAWTGQYTELRDILIKKAVKKYPEAEGVIITSNGERGVVIKFNK